MVRPLSLEQFGREQCSALSNTSSLLTREQQQLSGKSNLSLEWSVLRKAITGKVSCGGVSKLLSKSRTSHNCVLVLSLVVLSLCGNSSSTDGNTLCLLPTVQNFRVDEKLSNLMPSLKKEPFGTLWITDLALRMAITTPGQENNMESKQFLHFSAVFQQPVKRDALCKTETLKV